MISDRLVEDFSKKYGWSDNDITDISEEEISNMSMEEIEIYCDRMESIYPDGCIEFKHINQDASGTIVLDSEEDWK